MQACLLKTKGEEFASLSYCKDMNMTRNNIHLNPYFFLYSIYQFQIHITTHLQNYNQPHNQDHPSSPNMRAPPLNLNHPLLSKLEICPSLAHFQQIHAQIITKGLFHNVFAASRLLKFSATSLNSPNLPLTNLLFSQIKHPDVYSYNLVIKAHSYSYDPLNSLSLYKSLLIQGLHPNEYTLCFLLDCCSQASALWEGRQAHAQLHKHGLDLTIFSATSLIHMYGDCGAIQDAFRAFEQMRERSDVSWGAIIDAFIHHGEVIDAIGLFAEMRRAGIEPTEATVVSVLCACCKLGNPALGRALHAYIVVRGLEINVTLGTSLVDMYSKFGFMEIAMEVFSVMEMRSVASWNCLINGLAMNGHGTRAISLFREMERKGYPQPNEVTFLGLLHACSHKGLMDYGIRYFSYMTKVYGIAPGLKHFGCMVDLFGRAGQIKEAIQVIRGMPMAPDVVIWVTLLGACRVHGHERLAQLMAAQIIKMVPQDSYGCLLLSNIYASSGHWDEVAGVRKMMVEMSLRKEPGCSSIST